MWGLAVGRDVGLLLLFFFFCSIRQTPGLKNAAVCSVWIKRLWEKYTLLHLLYLVLKVHIAIKNVRDYKTQILDLKLFVLCTT